MSTKDEVARLIVLLVEDNEGDVELTRENLAESKVLHDLHVCRTGEEALSYLKSALEKHSDPIPDLILLDLNLPGKNGLEVLKELKQDEELRRIPVVILTSSEAELDIYRSYDLQASAYVVKSVDLKGFGKIVQGIEEFWFSIVRYPTE